jgi:hypothetical protein
MSDDMSTPYINTPYLTAYYNPRVMPNLPYTAEQRVRAKQVLLLHECTHMSDTALTNALSNGTLLGTGLTPRDVRNARAIYGPCVACMAGKTASYSTPPSESEPTSRVGEVIYCDLHMVDSRTIGGYTQFLIAVDTYSGYLAVVLLPTKTQPDVINAFDELLSRFRRYGHTVSTVVCDAEKVLIGAGTHLGLRGVVLLHTPPHQHAQRIERHIRSLLNIMRTIEAGMLLELPLYLRGELMKAAACHRNDWPHRSHPTTTPAAMVEGVKLDSNKRQWVPFGSVAMLHTPRDPDRQKTDAVYNMGVVIGPTPNTYKCLECFQLDTGNVVSRNDLTVLPRIPTPFPWAVKAIPDFNRDHILQVAGGVRTKPRLSAKQRAKQRREMILQRTPDSLLPRLRHAPHQQATMEKPPVDQTTETLASAVILIMETRIPTLNRKPKT